MLPEMTGAICPNLVARLVDRYLTDDQRAANQVFDLLHVYAICALSVRALLPMSDARKDLSDFSRGLNAMSQWSKELFSFFSRVIDPSRLSAINNFASAALEAEESLRYCEQALDRIPTGQKPTKVARDSLITELLNVWDEYWDGKDDTECANQFSQFCSEVVPIVFPKESKPGTIRVAIKLVTDRKKGVVPDD